MLKLGIFACVIVIFASGIAVLIVISLIKKSIKPLEQLKESMKQIGKGDFSSRVEVIADDEIGQLGNTYNSMAQNIETLIEKAYMLELAKKEAEIEFLKMQINPHFLYNTLDTISWMARTQNHIEISEVAMALGDLLRSNLKQKSMITIGEELKSVRNYVFIQEYRFGDKIQVEYEVDQGVKDYLIPNFILQPLVENSIIHGLEPKVEKGLLMVQIFIHEGQLFFRVVDDGIGMNQETISNIYYACEHETSKKCIGIKNVYRRLKLYYGEEGTLRISSEVGKGSRICFSIPMDKLEKVGEHK
nr:sensor histidine kinase [Aequitasia blattaphilus]